MKNTEPKPTPPEAILPRPKFPDPLLDHINESCAWLRGERSTANYIPQEPYETWTVRIAQADAAMTQQAYYTIKAYQERLVK